MTCFPTHLQEFILRLAETLGPLAFRCPTFHLLLDRVLHPLLVTRVLACLACTRPELPPLAVAIAEAPQQLTASLTCEELDLVWRLGCVCPSLALVVAPSRSLFDSFALAKNATLTLGLSSSY